MTLNDFIAKYQGKKVPYYGLAQCVALFRQYLDDVLHYPQPLRVKGAYDFWEEYDRSYFDRFGISPDTKPKEGDIVIWDNQIGNGNGHIAIFLQDNESGSAFMSLDQNWPIGSGVQLQVHTYEHVLGYLTPKLDTQAVDDDTINQMDPIEVTVISDTNLYVRKSPHLDAAIDRTLKKGDKVEVLGWVNGDDPGNGNPLWWHLREKRIPMLPFGSNDLYIWSGGTDHTEIPQAEIDWQDRAEVAEGKLEEIRMVID